MKKKIIFIITIVIIVITLISIYSTFAYNTEENNIELSNSDIYVEYSIKPLDNSIIINSMEEKYIDINVSNVYNAKVKYGIYYKMINPKKVPEGFNVTLDEYSQNKLEEIIDEKGEKTVTIKITNNSEYNINLELGTLIGFEKGDISSLLDEDMILVK